MPFFVQLLRKMSPKLGAMTARNPASNSACTAFSLDEPQPKFGSATKMRTPLHSGRFMTKPRLSGTRRRSTRRRSWNRQSANPSLRGRLRKRAGIAWSVSMLGVGIGSPTASRRVNGSISGLHEAAHIDQAAGHGSGGGHGGAHEMSADIPALRPTKLQLQVDAIRWPGRPISPFVPRHMKHPAVRHWNRASVKIRSSPSASACWRSGSSQAPPRPPRHRGEPPRRIASPGRRRCPRRWAGCASGRLPRPVQRRPGHSGGREG